MKTSMLRTGAALMLSAVLCGSALMLSGCGNRSHNPETSEAYAPFVPESKVAEDVPGKQYDAGIGQSIDYEGKVTASVDSFIELDDASTTEHRILLAEMTITNNSDKDIDCSTLTHFEVYIDDEKSASACAGLQAKITARKYYTQIQSTLEEFNQAIKPNETVTGYVPLYMPSAWKSCSLSYSPYKYYSNDNLNFSIDEAKLVHFSDSLK